MIFLNFRRRPYWKWRPSWNFFWSSITHPLMMVYFCIKLVLAPLEWFSLNSLDKTLLGTIIIIIIRNGAKTIYPRHFVFGDIIIIRNVAKTIYPRHFVFGDIIRGMMKNGTNTTLYICIGVPKQNKAINSCHRVKCGTLILTSFTWYKRGGC